MQIMDSLHFALMRMKVKAVFDFWNEFVVFPPNIVSSRVSPRHQSSAVTISLQKLTFSAFISFITLKRFKPTKRNFSVSVTHFSPKHSRYYMLIVVCWYIYERSIKTIPEKKDFKGKENLLFCGWVGLPKRPLFHFCLRKFWVLKSWMSTAPC